MRTFERNYNGENIVHLLFPSLLGSLSQNAWLIQQCLESLKRVTGCTDYDVLTNCKGALDQRMHRKLYGNLQFTSKRIVNVAPAHHGFIVIGEAIGIARHFKETGKDKNNPLFPIRALGGYYINADTREGLSSIRTDVCHNNPELRALNSDENLRAELAGVEKITVIAGTGLPFLATRVNIPFLSRESDSVVPVWSARRGNAHMCVIRCQATLPPVKRNLNYPLDPHKAFILDEAVVARAVEELTGDPMPAELREKRVVQEIEPQLDGPLQTSVPFVRAAVDCSAGMLIGCLIAAGARLHAQLGCKTHTYFGAIRLGPHMPAKNERRAS